MADMGRSRQGKPSAENRALPDLGTELRTRHQSIPFAPGWVIAARFELLEMLGCGNMGTVYKVEDRLMYPRLKALKVMLPSLAGNADTRKQFVTEAEIGQSLLHNGIVTVYDIGQEGDLPFFTMELLLGGNLESWLKVQGGRANIETACTIVLKICEALGHAHERDVIHRGIKPQNIFILPDGGVKLTDFGLAKLMSAAQLTRQGVNLGTAYYMAPEQSLGREVDARADIYSVGVVLYQMLVGHIPMGWFPFPGELFDEIPETIDSVIKRCLQPRPEDRYADARSLAGAVAEVLDGLREGPGRKREYEECKKKQELLNRWAEEEGKFLQGVGTGGEEGLREQEEETLWRSDEEQKERQEEKRKREEPEFCREEQKAAAARGVKAWMAVLLLLVIGGVAIGVPDVRQRLYSMWDGRVGKRSTTITLGNDLEQIEGERNRVEDGTLLAGLASEMEPGQLRYDGTHMYEKGEYLKDVAYLTRVLEAEPGWAAGYNRRGIAYYRLGRYDDAIRDYTRAIELTPKYFAAYNNRGAAYRQLGRHDNAVRDCTRATELKPDLDTAYYIRGTAYLELQRYSEAYRDLERACNLGFPPGCTKANQIESMIER